MYRGLLFMIVIWSVTGFNVQITPLKHFKKDDPLFGQTIIQSTDGVFVPSPKTGALFRCTLTDECTEVDSDKPKGLRPVASVSSLISEEEHVMMCNQVRIKKSATEDLNGDCKLMNPSEEETEKLTPVLLVNNNNNNNRYQGGRTGLDHWRMRRNTQPDSDTKDKENNYDDAGTKIAFVLDGSGSIDADDFQRAKDFIYNVMSSVWKICFNCDFAVVQYGLEVRTELSLLDSKNHARALQKVKEIQQLGKITRTASAIHHILTDIFIPENGSKINSKKIIIVLSDGQILGDPINLNDVLNMPQMKDVTRYSIGVGEGILSNPKAMEEMKEIADPGKFFNVSNYAALDGIQSSLEQGLTGAEVNVPLPSRSALLSPVTNQIENEKLNSNNNNKNHYQGGRIDEVKRRMRRDAQLDGDTKAEDDFNEDEDDDDAGTEIAFVLDGSGSIDANDFQRAKDFIYNVMFNVWNICFNCDFAIVQYGQEVRTELSLLDNKDGARTLQKVKEIQQLGKITMTASAIHHVLTDIFIPENGSKNNSKKIIIVLSDGKILGDPMKLSDVLKMPQMKGVTRYSIGVGDGILKDTEAIQEMKEIADPEKFFNVSNYAALDDILSKLEKSITEFENKGAGFQFELAEAGFSSHLMQHKSVLYGAVGAYDWSGGVFVQSGDTVKFLNDSNNGPKFSYLGYSVTSAKVKSSRTLYISGAPRYNLTGGVFIFDGSEKYVLQGDQVGSYFGSVLCALDIDEDTNTDYLLVGAPHFHQIGEEGKVLVYKLNQEGRFESVAMELQGDAGQTFARFGAAIASIGDIDRNKFIDVAVGAPLETDSSGSIYIYNGFIDGLRFSQKISAADLEMKIMHFGQSISGAPAMAPHNAAIAVGSKGGVLIFETIPVIVIKPAITIDINVIPLDQQLNKISSKFDIKYFICFNVVNEKLQSQLAVKYQIALDFGVSKKRITADRDISENTFTLTPDAECAPVINLKYLGCFDCFSPIKIKLQFSLDPKETSKRILDAFTPTEVVNEITFEKDCKVTDCKPSITLSDSKISETLIIVGETQSLNINMNLTNTEDPSYMTTLTLTFPSILIQRKTEGAICPVKNDNQIQCNLQHPIFKRDAQTNLFISWQLSDTKSDLINSKITANLTSQNHGSEILDTKIYGFAVKYSLPIQLTGTANPSRLSIEEGGKAKTQNMQFLFQFAGENKYGANISVTVTITKNIVKSDLDIISVKPQEKCVFPENTKVERSYTMTCKITELQEIIIDANVLIHDVEDKANKITAEGTFSFDETVYDAKNTLRTAQAEVIITKLHVTSSKGAIIGGSIGGFLLLFIIIIILIKCGFFRRRHKMDQTQSGN